jgi:CheY-like chemotaxis protein/anti-sigma regulatory factor (Ser/Thr protein kinase)
LHALGLFAAVLEQKVDRPEARDLTRSINASVDALEQLFSAIMDISKLDAGVVQATIAEIPISDVLERVRAEFAEPARAKGLSFRVRPVEGVVRTDTVLAQRILNNLVANAIRYTPRGGVLVGCRRRGSAVRVEIWDTGVGIARSELPRIFEEFYQVGNLERDRSKGMGLGLAIVRRLSALLDHRVDVRSSPGKGSCFSVELPLLRTESTRSARRVHAEAERLKGKLLVVIDDEPSVREGMDLLLRQWGCRPVSCGSIEEALNALAGLGRAPDGVIADYRLRGETGAQAIRALRERFGEALPAVIITGDIGADRLAEFAAQRYFYLHKPVPPMELRTLLDSLFEGSRSAPEALSPAQPV